MIRFWQSLLFFLLHRMWKALQKKMSTTTIQQNNIHPWKKANSKHIKSSYLNYVLQDYSILTRFLLLNNNNLVHFYHAILSFNLSEQISRHGLFSENMIQICTKTIYVRIFYSYFYHLIYTNDIVVDFRETKNVVRFNG